MLQYSNELLDQYICRDLSSLNSCGATEIDKVPPYVYAYALNCALMLNGPVQGTTKLAMNFMRRLQKTVDDYRHGARNLKDYVGALPREHRLISIVEALNGFESAILNFDVYFSNYFELFKQLHGDYPNKKDRTADFYRLTVISNRIKHYHQDVAALSGSSTDVPISPIWLTADSIVSTVASIRFDEIEAMIEAAKSDASFLSTEMFRIAMERKSQRES